jgi:hypothetical protein
MTTESELREKIAKYLFSTKGFSMTWEDAVAYCETVGGAKTQVAKFRAQADAILALTRSALAAEREKGRLAGREEFRQEVVQVMRKFGVTGN